MDPARLTGACGYIQANEPAAERPYELPTKSTPLVCGQCGHTWPSWMRTSCGRCAEVGVSIGRAFQFVEAVCMHRADYGQPGPECGAVEEVHISRICGYNRHGYLFVCDVHR